MPTSEIEKLERRYAENPQGLTFAPLAEVHRKNGDIPRALELLGAGLELHPNYIPASIVLGRCHWDLGDLPAAESAFAHVLRLDDENVIALKSLADINERQERFADAQRWLHRLVAVDRSNEEARQQLSRLEAAKDRAKPAAAKPQPAEAKLPEPKLPEPKPPEAKLPEATPPDVKPPVTAAAPEPPALIEAAPSVTRDQAKDAPEQPEPKSSTLEFIDTSEPGAAGEAMSSPEEPSPLPGLISQEFVPPKEATYKLHPELTREFVPPREPPNQFDVEISEEVELRSSGADEFRVPNAAEDFMDLAAQVRPSPAETPAEEPPAPVPVPQPEKKHEVSQPSYSARDTRGQSVASFFQALLAARPPGNSTPLASASETPAEADGSTRPAEDPLSLSSVFEEAERSAPAEPASAQTKDGTVSFDDFFSSAAGGSSPLPQGSNNPKTDDLDQFQSWLQNLKR